MWRGSENTPTLDYWENIRDKIYQQGQVILFISLHRPAPALRPLTGWNYSSSRVAELHKELTLPSFSCRNPSSLGYFQLWFWCLLLDENGWVIRDSSPVAQGTQLGHAIISRSKMTSALRARKTLLSVLNGGSSSLLPNIICSVSVY